MSKPHTFCQDCGYALALHRTAGTTADPLKICPDLPPLFPGKVEEKIKTLEAALDRAIKERDAARDNYLKAQKDRDALWLTIQNIRRMTGGS